MTNVAEDLTQRPYAASRPGMRVNARLDEVTQRELQQLVRDTGLSVTEVIRAAIHRYYLQEAAQGQSVADSFVDLIGSIDGPADMSVTYKQACTQSLRDKHA